MAGDDTAQVVALLLDFDVSEQQRQLLREILWPVVDENRTEDALWPKWNFVSRGFARDGFGDAQFTFDSLPVLDGPRGTYGLVWRTMPGAGRQIRPDERVGLTLAGLYLADPHSGHERANRLAQLVALLGDQEARDSLDPDQVITRTVQLGDVAAQYLNLSEWRSRTTSMTLRAAVHLLGREPVPITVEWDRDAAVIGDGYLEPYREVATAREYLAELVHQTGLHDTPSLPSAAPEVQSAVAGSRAPDSASNTPIAPDTTLREPPMNGWPAWAQDAREVADARVLAGLLTSLGEDGQTTSATAPLVEELGLAGVDPDHLAVRLVELGYFREDSLSLEPGSDTLLVTGQGRRAASEFAAARRKIKVAPAARTALLRWLYESDEGRQPNLPDFLTQPGSWFYGAQFTLDQATDAARNLRDRGFIDAVATLQSDLLRLKLTPRGVRCIERYNADPDALDDSASQSGTDESVTGTSTTSGSAVTSNGIQTVFVVHGHDETLKYKVARFIERVLDPTRVQVVLLDEQANAGQTLFEKFETYADSASYAVILLTPDDEGGPVSGGTPQKRARQNVVFELGYFCGRIRRNRVAAINYGVEIPSDFNGVVYIGPDQWMEALRRELHSAKLPMRP